jgi:hypothetical protein
MLQAPNQNQVVSMCVRPNGFYGRRVFLCDGERLEFRMTTVRCKNDLAARTIFEAVCEAS